MRQKTNLSREAATAHSARPIGVAASRLTVSFLSQSAGLRPQLRAVAASRLKRATSTSVSEGRTIISLAYASGYESSGRNRNGQASVDEIRELRATNRSRIFVYR
jgi:hypothetical protein